MNIVPHPLCMVPNVITAKWLNGEGVKVFRNCYAISLHGSNRA